MLEKKKLIAILLLLALAVPMLPLNGMLIGGVVTFSLATVLFSANQMKPEILDSEEYGFYSTHYLDNLRQIKIELTGKDLQTLNILPSPKYQECFDYVLVQKLENPELDKAQEIQLAKTFFNIFCNRFPFIRTLKTLIRFYIKI